MAEKKPNTQKIGDIQEGSKQGSNPKYSGAAAKFQGKAATEVERKAEEGGGQTSGGNFANRDPKQKGNLKESKETKKSD